MPGLGPGLAAARENHRTPVSLEVTSLAGRAQLCSNNTPMKGWLQICQSIINVIKGKYRAL